MSIAQDSPQEPEGISVPLLDLKAQYLSIRGEIDAAIKRVIESQYFILGPEVEALESEIATYSECQYGVGVSSGSDALLVALMAIGLVPGDEVITSTYSFFATAGAIARLGATPVFADINPQTYNIDPVGIEELITERTRAIIPVYLYGQMADMVPIMEIAKRHHLRVIEDAAQAIGAEIDGQRAGSIGDLGCFSFYPSKNLGGYGDGGMVTTSDPDLADRVRLFRNHGASPKYYNKVIGGNFRLDAIQAAVLRVKMKYLEKWTSLRNLNAEKYKTLFAEAGCVIPANSLPCLKRECKSEECRLQQAPGIVLPYKVGGYRHIYNQFVIRCGQRDALMAHLKRQEIATEIYYPLPLHLQECFLGLGYRKGDLPISECASRQTLALPIFPELTDKMMASVVFAINEFY